MIITCSVLSVLIVVLTTIFLTVRRVRFRKCLCKVEGRVRSVSNDKCTVYVESLNRDYIIRGPADQLAGLSVNSKVNIYINRNRPKDFYSSLQYKKSTAVPILIAVVLLLVIWNIAVFGYCKIEEAKSSEPSLVQYTEEASEIPTVFNDEEETITEVTETFISINTEAVDVVESFATIDTEIEIPSEEVQEVFEGDMFSLSLSSYEDVYINYDEETTETTEEETTEKTEETTSSEIIEDDYTEPEPELVKQLPIPIIIDTDFASDCDDILAVRLGNVFQDQGILSVQGIALSTSYSKSPLALHALCKADGYGSIPVAMDTSGNGVQVHTDYVDVMAEYPRSTDAYKQPVQMYRRILSQAPTKVNIITLGFLQNLEDLLNSKSDDISPYTGIELIQQKVDTLYIVGGNDSGKPEFNFYYGGDRCIASAKTIAANWPGAIVYLTQDLTYDTFCGQFYQTEDTSKKDIATKALAANNQAGGVVAWDVFALWCAVQHMADNMIASDLGIEQGNFYISDTGGTIWQDTVLPRYRIVKFREGGTYNSTLNSLLHSKFGGS